MSVIRATSVGLSFGALDVFSGVSAVVPPGGKVGLVGPNGVGKTSLLLILAGLGEPTAGRVHRSRGTRIGYLPQESDEAFAGREHTVFDEMLGAFAELRAHEARLREMEEAISSGEADDELLERYGKLQEEFERGGGYGYEQRIRRVLSGLGFDQEDRRLPLPHLSGGQKTRALLARLLLEEPDLLILDEPTNHLDVAAIEWLEGLLGAWAGAVLVVSHDRYFLDRVVKTVWEMSPTGIETYRGNYSAYALQRGERWERRHKEFRALKERLAREMDFIKRNMASQRTQMAQGKLARVSREVEAIHAGGIEVLGAIKSKGWMQATAGLDMERPSSKPDEVARRINELHLPTGGPPEIKLQLTPAKRGGDIVLRTSALQVGFPGAPLFTSEDIQLERRECAALMGGNGTGKTTFLRTLLGRVEPVAGEARLGGGLTVGHFAQAHADLRDDNTVLDELLRHRNMPLGEARGYLAQFLFRQDDVFKRVAALSGGERGRLALALLALQRANLLLLDEPTNHLDIPAQEVLQAVLERFEGTIILVSHDRYLIDRLATQIWEVRDGQLTVFPGDYRTMLSERRMADDAARSAPKEPAGDDGSPGAGKNEAHRWDEMGETDETDDTDDKGGTGKRLSKNELRRLEERRSEIEREIEALENRRVALEAEIQAASETGEFERVRALSAEHDAIGAEMSALYDSWSALG